MVLPSCNVQSGTNLVYGTTRVIRAAGTDLAYGTTSTKEKASLPSPPLAKSSGTVLCRLYAMSGTGMGPNTLCYAMFAVQP